MEGNYDHIWDAKICKRRTITTMEDGRRNIFDGWLVKLGDDHNEHRFAGLDEALSFMKTKIKKENL